MKIWLAVIFYFLLTLTVHPAILMQPYLQAVNTNSVYVLVECNDLFIPHGGDYCASSDYTSWKNEFFLANELNLDSYSSGSPQYLFAQSDLQASTKTWKIVFDHNPAYCSGGHNEDAGMVAMSKNVFVPNKVDMVISGHSHFYQHNYVDGIHHMVIGDAGAPQTTPGYAPYTVLSVQDYEFGIIDVTPSSFTLKIYNTLNLKFDSVKLIKSAPITGPLRGIKTIGPLTSNHPDGTILLNNIKYLRIDGRPGGTGSPQLTIENQHSTGNAIRFIHDASDNRISYCMLKGVNTLTSSGTTPGVLFFGTTSLTAGNDNNFIEHCVISNGEWPSDNRR